MRKGFWGWGLGSLGFYLKGSFGVGFWEGVSFFLSSKDSFYLFGFFYRANYCYCFLVDLSYFLADFVGYLCGDVRGLLEGD